MLCRIMSAYFKTGAFPPAVNAFVREHAGFINVPFVLHLCVYMLVFYVLLEQVQIFNLALKGTLTEAIEAFRQKRRRATTSAP